MKVQQTLAQTWKRRRGSDHATAKRLIEERGVGLLRVPDELLDIILGFSDLATRFTSVQTSHQFSGSVARLSPQLEYRALRKRFPLLAIVMDADPAHAPTAPRELFLTYSRFFGRGADAQAPRLEPTVALDSYTLALQLEIIRPTLVQTQRETLFVGIGTVDTSENNKACFEFAVPPGIFTTVDNRLEWGTIRDAQIKIVATRRAGARLQHAELYCEGIHDGDEDFFYFGYQDLPDSSSTSLLRWYGDTHECTPGLTVTWTRDSDQRDPNGNWRQNAPSTINARFSWCNPGDIVDMPLADACLTLEHYVDWK